MLPRQRKVGRQAAEMNFSIRSKIVLFLLVTYFPNSLLPSNVRTGYFVTLGEDETGSQKRISTVCAHQCLAAKHCKYVQSGDSEGECKILDRPPATGKYLMKTGFRVNCLDAKQQGVQESSVISVHPPNTNNPIDVFCDMATHGGGWTVIQRRLNGLVSFERNWSEYQKGFGNLMEDFWLGLENLHILTTAEDVEFRIDLINHHNETGFAHYTTFKVSDDADFYRLAVGGYSGTVGDAFADPAKANRIADGMQFSTVDKKNDPSTINCAYDKTGGWWFNECYLCHPNGRFGVYHNNDTYMTWLPWNNNIGDLSFIEMKIRPKL